MLCLVELCKSLRANMTCCKQENSINFLSLSLKGSFDTAKRRGDGEYERKQSWFLIFLILLFQKVS